MITALVSTPMPVLAPTTTDCYVTYEDVNTAVTAAFSAFELQVQDRIMATVAKANQECTPIDSYYYDTESGLLQLYIQEIPYLEQAKKEAVLTQEELIAQIEQELQALKSITPPEVSSYLSAADINFPALTDTVIATDNTVTASNSLSNRGASNGANTSNFRNYDNNVSEFSLPTNVLAFLSFNAPAAPTNVNFSASTKSHMFMGVVEVG
ncbi:hypothetical protein C0992_009306 [Termitomyces sp. T32_za158]|nr:hypothetical protein C0992_009306 [Termitomyces sp. T32_za158]